METDGIWKNEEGIHQAKQEQACGWATDLKKTGPNGIPHKQGWTVKNMLNHHLSKLYPLVKQYSWVEIHLSH